MKLVVSLKKIAWPFYPDSYIMYMYIHYIRSSQHLSTMQRYAEHCSKWRLHFPGFHDMIRVSYSDDKPEGRYLTL